jgi:hypothetical protein
MPAPRTLSEIYERVRETGEPNETLETIRRTVFSDMRDRSAA